MMINTTRHQSFSFQPSSHIDTSFSISTNSRRSSNMNDQTSNNLHSVTQLKSRPLLGHPNGIHLSHHNNNNILNNHHMLSNRPRLSLSSHSYSMGHSRPRQASLPGLPIPTTPTITNNTNNKPTSNQYSPLLPGFSSPGYITSPASTNVASPVTTSTPYMGNNNNNTTTSTTTTTTTTTTNNNTNNGTTNSSAQGSPGGVRLPPLSSLVAIANSPSATTNTSTSTLTSPNSISYTNTTNNSILDLRKNSTHGLGIYSVPSIDNSTTNDSTTPPATPGSVAESPKSTISMLHINSNTKNGVTNLPTSNATPIVSNYNSTSIHHPQINRNNSIHSNIQIKSEHQQPPPPPPATTLSGKQCPVCGKVCSRPSTLKTHYLIHTGDTPYKCKWLNCTKSFNVKSNMLRHLKNHEKKLEKMKEQMIANGIINDEYFERCYTANAKVLEVLHTKENEKKKIRKTSVPFKK
ncbi:hypothetical protein TBLA_0E03930 [Henningerozyma blattae CBS 6284]|uniref:C2H2-type domain-containing protein n=1 Tax=Henningerozyma blattae (strain ATCC 34711 / CBS 6284 / DSM 70876 / NBRC 10599 / NRRL Y-10934 / UCD 77-7) TaxID=1071380 RepID=I2H4Z6_HENB6|nr:hypothetical protein TBLA_0E03930 [Tetrapisispora blattae CBS 6284]CCH61448.1 hypothetical protein TBLA_0E03930 [Tetrapisispora blattae CBS 6284]